MIGRVEKKQKNVPTRNIDCGQEAENSCVPVYFRPKSRLQIQDNLHAFFQV